MGRIDFAGIFPVAKKMPQHTERPCTRVQASVQRTLVVKKLGMVAGEPCGGGLLVDLCQRIGNRVDSKSLLQAIVQKNRVLSGAVCCSTA